MVLHNPKETRLGYISVDQVCQGPVLQGNTLQLTQAFALQRNVGIKRQVKGSTCRFAVLGLFYATGAPGTLVSACFGGVSSSLGFISAGSASVHGFEVL
ncbi:hypothetical protein ROHU_015511 [Labeo rohita]|uniref:Uncharacterized protein n=1 Tax=Labeo rohita TaxID=84645 RepID=A0A498NNQ3_LABRO|nr:hypothetical protein ROHU_015511 [Labeo rohita]